MPDVALREPLASSQLPLTRHVVTQFIDLAGFTSLSERLARRGTRGSEQLGTLIRRTIGGALDVMSNHGGDSLTFGGDSILVAFAGATAWERAARAADEVIGLVRSTAGTPTLAGPVDLSIRIGISGGRVTSLVCPARNRHIVIHLGPGLDRAVAAQGRAQLNTRVVEPVAALEVDDGGRRLHAPPPSWTARVLHPVTALRIASGDTPPDEHRRVTAVFVSVTTFDDREPVALSDFSKFVMDAADLIDELGGDILHCAGGDKGIVMMALFGAPVAHADDGVRAVHAIERLRAKCAVDFAAGIASGLAFTGVFGGRSRAFPSALGDVVNVAARLMVAAGNGVTLVDAATSTGVRGLATLGPADTAVVKGRGEPVVVSRVLTLDTSERRFDSAGITPPVGREAELAAVEELLECVARGEGSSLAVIGEAGTGKSRLIAETGRRAEVRGLRVQAAAFEAFGLGRPLEPIAQLVRLRLGSIRLDTDHDIRAAVTVALGDHDELAPLLGPILGVPMEDSRFTATLSEQEGSELTRRLVVDLLCSTSAATLVLLEDLHWADELSLLLIGELTEQLPRSQLALAVTSRSELSIGSARCVVLGEMTDDDLATVARETWTRLGGGELPADYVKTLAERSAGSPMFAETVTELVRRSWRPGDPLPPVPLSGAVLSFLTGRLDELGDRAQHTALCWAILSRPATVGEMTWVFGLTRQTVEEDLDYLVEAGIVRRADAGSDALTWLRHTTVAEALLARASYASRAPLHERVCRHLVEIEASAREIARHLEHCRLPDLEDHTYRRARQAAWTAWALSEARHWAELAVQRGDDADRDADQVDLAELELLLGEHQAAAQRLRLLSDTANMSARVERMLGRIAFETGRPHAAVEHLTRAEDAGEDKALVSWPLTMALCDLSRFEEARDRARAQLARAGDDDRRLRLDALANLGAVLGHQRDLPGAATALQQARALASELGDLMRLAVTTGDLAGIRFLQGELIPAAELLNEATSLAYRLGARRVLNLALGNMAHVRLAAGDRDGASRTAMAGAEASLRISDVAIALDFAEVLIVVAELEGDRSQTAAWWRRHGELEERLGRRLDAAISFLRSAPLLAAEAAVGEARQAISQADRASAGLRSEDLAEHRRRALDACGGDRQPPPETVTSTIDLPPLDLALPPVTAASVEALLDRIAQLLAATKPPVVAPSRSS